MPAANFELRYLQNRIESNFNVDLETNRGLVTLLLLLYKDLKMVRAEVSEIKNKVAAMKSNLISLGKVKRITNEKEFKQLGISSSKEDRLLEYETFVQEIADKNRYDSIVSVDKCIQVPT